MANYIPNTPDQVQEMLRAIGADSVEELFDEIPPELKLQNDLDMPAGVSELEMSKQLKELAAQNKTVDDTVCFLGGGAYDHIIPAAIDHLLLRGDFFTAYTPYQAEVSQGTLQSIYEYQSLICSLTAMEQSNASMYEGGSALAEAVNMATAQTRRNRVLMLQTVNPLYKKVAESISGAMGTEIITVEFDEVIIDPSKVKKLLNEEIAAVVIQYPNFFGGIEDVEAISQAAKSVGALTIVSTNPIALGLLEAPGNIGADIVTGEGQPLGIPLSFGGPYLGFLAAQKNLLRRMPGRIVGRTKDIDGKDGFVLTLQAREQHIRREKASSNICSNQGLMALTVAIYLSLLGKEGLKDVANQCFQKTRYMKKELQNVAKVTSPYNYSFFNEFVVKIPNAKKILAKMAKNGIFAGIALEDYFPKLKDEVLIAVTEKRTKQEIDDYCKMLGGFLND